uniref:class I SAM-dependent methyltransferase n=1 Tax=Sphingomonas bacterium TaxID=1895847 RepID=UPI002613A28A|nr:methyltransferase domain-containing protein [Sphingomonas bacterium]
MSSNEEELLGSAIYDLICEFSTAKGRILDIGSADGRICEKYIYEARESFAIEPNAILYSLLKRRLSAKTICLLGEFPDLPKVHLNLDAIVASHMLYHLDQNNLVCFLQCARSQLKYGGILILVLWNNESEAWKLCARYTPERWLWTAEDVVSDATLNDIAGTGFKLIKEAHISPSIKAYTAEAQRAIFRFLFGSQTSPALLGDAFQDHSAVFSLRAGLDNSQTIFVLRAIE